ncbi:pentapeptide repeat-containing protein [Microcoleus sp. A003_D6]|uniref:pentapeptide repeat-containing protein n=1 Tax=Microcoleus sp. A003_D6 TaxID=3055266 RepID=UPI002FD22318
MSIYSPSPHRKQQQQRDSEVVKTIKGKNVRGYCWNKANLHEANFVKIQAGVPITWVIFQTVGLTGLAGVTGILSALAAIWGTGLIGSKAASLPTTFLGLGIIILVVVGLLLTAKRGFTDFLGFSLITLSVSSILFIFLKTSLLIDAFVYISFTVTSELLALWLGAMTFAASRSISKRLLTILSSSALAGIGITLNLVSQVSSDIKPNWIDVTIATAILLTGAIIGWKAFEPSSRFPGIARLAINLTAIAGTSFQGANLTEADFSQANLKHTDFRNANLMRTSWYDVQGLEFARLENTYLANPKIRQLVITLKGEFQNFDGLNLEGVNLQDAYLQGASFIGTNLNNANLRDANLSRAILKQAQLDGTDMTGAILTGACIEDWGITGSTNLEGLKCGYVFMRLKTTRNPNRLRKPDNWGETFAGGDFADFIKPYVDTLDLYHSQDIDPRAISIALKNLSTNHPEQELRFVAIERRGDKGLNLRFTTAPGADKSELSREYFTEYARIKKELPIAVQLKLAEQDGEIRTLKGTIEQFIKIGTHQSKIQAETIQIVQGELIMTQNKGINIRSGGGSIGDISGLVGGDGVVNLGTISGNVTNTIEGLPDASEPDEPNIKELLTQLQQIIENDSDLSEPDKADLLEQVQALAEAKQTEEPAKKEGLTRKARKMFEATLSSLPQTASIVEACSKLLPTILKALGLPA